MQNRISVLDSFRGIAAAAVMLFHYTAFYSDHIMVLNLPDFLKFHYGQYGVHLFFMISGFVIFMTVSKVSSPATFLYKRFIRLYPTYWISLSITALFILVFPFKLYSFSFNQLLGNLTMFQGLMGISNIDGSYWSLLPELLFYLMMVVLIMFKLERRIGLLCYIWIVCMLLNLLRPSVLEVLMNLRFGVFFMAGIMFYKIFKSESGIHHHFIILITNALVFLIFKDVETNLVFAFLILVFYLFVYGKLNFFHHKVLSFLGAISYPLYLIHQTIGIILIYWLIKIGLNTYIAIFSAIFVALLLGTALYYRFERPVLTYLGTKLRTKSSTVNSWLPLA